MELYTKTSYQLAQQLTLQYSTSFGKSISLFSTKIRPHIFAIYALARIADEIVDTYNGTVKVKAKLLNELEAEVAQAVKNQYSANPIVHAFALTAKAYDITSDLIDPFFASMRFDLEKTTYTKEIYQTYIFGSAEVIGLMCLKVFCEGDKKLYKKLVPGAKALGSAYQKVNFLRDIASDFEDRGRVYFPGVQFDMFNEVDKAAIVAEINQELIIAKKALQSLPNSSRNAVLLSYSYYLELLRRIEKTPAEKLKTTRIRVPDTKKVALLFKASLRKKAGV